MAAICLTVYIHVAWWLRLYLYGVVICCTMTNLPPHEERLAYWIRKGVSVRVGS